jgi:hypothetical protein
MLVRLSVLLWQDLRNRTLTLSRPAHPLIPLPGVRLQGGGATPASLDFTEKDFTDKSVRQCLNHLESVSNLVRGDVFDTAPVTALAVGDSRTATQVGQTANM